MTISKARAKSKSARIEEAESQHDVPGCGDSAQLVTPVAGDRRSQGIVGRAVAAIAPNICSVCCLPRKGLEPFQERSAGATGATRTVWKCVDCCELGELADLAQCDVRESQPGSASYRRDGNRQVGKGGGAR